MGIDWGEALASGVAAGAGEVSHQIDEQDQDARWLERQQKMQALETDSAKQKERYLLGLKPPETRKLNVQGADGKPMVQQQEWRLPEGSDKGEYVNVGDAEPDINFERLAETQKNNEERNRLTGDRNAALADAAAARIDMARERLAAEEARKAAGGDKGADWEVRDNTDSTGAGTYVRVNKRTGEVQPLTMNGQPVTTFHGGEKQAQSIEQQKKIDAVKGTLSQFASAIGLGKAADAMPKFTAGSTPQPSAAPAAPPAQPKPAATNGKAPYAEGQTIFDKQGRKYVVKNGQPVLVQ